jgi:5,10-methylenetetrahydrofolate reductase
MKVLAEVTPNKKLNKLKNEIDKLSIFDGFDVPDAPLGEPNMLPVSIATILRLKFEDKEIIVNQRLHDVNELYVHSLSITARSFNFNLLFTKGDKPKVGKEVGYLNSEEAVMIAKNYGVKSGMILSLRKADTEILHRLHFPADFYLVLNYTMEKLLKFSEYNIIPYIIIITEKNKEIVYKLNQNYFKLGEIKQIFEYLESNNIKKVLVSAPNDIESLYKLLKK